MVMLQIRYTAIGRHGGVSRRCAILHGRLGSGRRVYVHAESTKWARWYITGGV